jgi:hypothetical protein
MTTAIVAKVDHEFVPLDAPEPAFRFLTETLALPVAWPFTPYGAFASGGVALGGINLEVLQASEAYPFFTAARPARVRGIAFEPTPIDAAFLAELDRRGIPHSPPMPFHGSGHGTSGLLWTNVFLPDFLDERAIAFVCEYHVPEARDVPARRAALRAAGGGRLGIEDVREIVIGSPDPAAAAGRWRRLLHPHAEPVSGHWMIGNGPALRIEAGAEDAVLRLVLQVSSREHARRALAAFGLPAIDTGGEIVLQAPVLSGLDVRLL